MSFGVRGTNEYPGAIAFRPLEFPFGVERCRRACSVYDRHAVVVNRISEIVFV